jgi:hypothetical protein
MYQKLLVPGRGVSPAYSTLTNWIRAFDREEDIFSRSSVSGRRPDVEIDVLIADELDESAFPSV